MENVEKAERWHAKVVDEASTQKLDSRASFVALLCPNEAEKEPPMPMKAASPDSSASTESASA